MPRRVPAARPSHSGGLMRFGHFDDANREYVITTPRTPYPWINYLGTEEFFGLVSHTGGGYCFYRDARLRRLTRYRYNNVPTDIGGRYFYINDGGDVWTPGWMPVKRRAGLLRVPRTASATPDHRRAERACRPRSCFFVPLGTNAEVHQVTLTNTSRRQQEPEALLVRRVLPVERLGRHDQLPAQLLDRRGRGRRQRRSTTRPSTASGATTTPFYSVNAKVAGFDTDRESFLGAYNGFDEPQVRRARASRATPWPAAGRRSPRTSSTCDLAPGEEKTFVFVLGYVENPGDEKWEKPGVINKKPAQALIAALPDDRAGRRGARRRCATTGRSCSSTYTVKSRRARLDRMVNIWNQYQCMVTFNMSRSASYFETGIGRGMGFRDSNQDLLGFVHLVPGARPGAHPRHRRHAVARRQRLPPVPAADQARQQRHRQRLQRRPAVADLGHRRLHQGDGRLVDPGRERCPSTTTRANSATLFEHLKRSFHHVLNNLGPHGLPLIGRADWNDCLNLNCFSETPDESFQTTGNRDGRTAESVFIAGMFVHVAPDYADSAEALGLADEAQRARDEQAEDGADRARARLGRRVVPARLRLLRQQGRQPRSARRARSSSSRRASA